MRSRPTRVMEQHRITSGEFGTKHRSSVNGFYQAMILRIIASDGLNEDGTAEVHWDHVSVSTKQRCPQWGEMEWVREQFFMPSDLVLQFSVPRTPDKINHHPYCLHMWRHHDQVVLSPPSILVGPPDRPLTQLEQSLITNHGMRMRE